MKIYIPSFNRPKTHLTGATLGEDIDWKYVLHDDEQWAEYLDEGLPYNRAIISNVPRSMGLGGQRAWIQDNLVSHDEWYIQMDDNVQQFTRVRDPYYTTHEDYLQWDDRRFQDRVFNNVITPDDFMLEVVPEMLAKAEKFGTSLCGFASTKNTFFRAKKWTKIGFVVGKVMILKNDGICRFNSSFFTSDDYQITAENLLHHGAVCRNNFVYPDFPRYMVGGLGKLADRQKPYAVAAQQLLEHYGDCYRINTGRKDMDEGSAVKLRFSDRSVNALNEWRRSQGVSV